MSMGTDLTERTLALHVTGTEINVRSLADVELFC